MLAEVWEKQTDSLLSIIKLSADVSSKLCYKTPVQRDSVRKIDHYVGKRQKLKTSPTFRNLKDFVNFPSYGL